MVEYEAVLKRPEHLVETGLDTGDIDVFLDNIAALCERFFLISRTDPRSVTRMMKYSSMWH
jgi:hypothetical protein